MRTTTERIADRLKNVARTVVDKVRHVPREAGDLAHVVKDEVPNIATAHRTVIIERQFAAPPEKLYKAWTDASWFTRWWGPEGFATTDVRIDLRVGGRWENTMIGPDGKRYPCGGEFRELTPPSRLVMFDEGKDEVMKGHATKIEVTFEPSGSGTKMRLVHGVFKTVEMRDECKTGWSSSFDRLERLLGK